MKAAHAQLARAAGRRLGRVARRRGGRRRRRRRARRAAGRRRSRGWRRCSTSACSCARWRTPRRPRLGPRRAGRVHALARLRLLHLPPRDPRQCLLFRAPLTTLGIEFRHGARTQCAACLPARRRRRRRRRPDRPCARRYLILTLLLQPSPPVPFVLARSRRTPSTRCNAYAAIAYLPSFARGVVEPRVAFLRTEEGRRCSRCALGGDGRRLPPVPRVRPRCEDGDAHALLLRTRAPPRRLLLDEAGRRQLVERVRDLGKHRFVPAPVGGFFDAMVSTLSKVFALSCADAPIR